MLTMKFPRRAIATLLVLAAWAAPAVAQQTRREELERRREEKARQIRKHKPGTLEAALLYIEDKQILERFGPDIDGFYPAIGGLPPGFGIAGGVGYRKHVGDHAIVRASIALSTKSYKLATAEFMTPVAGGRVEFGGHARWRSFPQEDYFGLGNDSPPAGRVSFLLEDTDFTATGAIRFKPWLRVGARAGYLNVDIGHGTDRRFPSIEQRFSEQTAPGLARQPDFTHGDVFVDVDYRDQPGNARAGGRYYASFERYHDVDFSRYSFGRVDGDVQQFFPIFDKKRVIALRGRVVYANNRRGHEVPFYMLPTIGGNDTVRSFHDYRFRDETAIFFNAEYRWEAFAGLDMSVFFDAGKVQPNFQDINLKRLKTGYGVGFRFNSYKSVFLRLDVAGGGREGTRFFVKFGPAF